MSELLDQIEQMRRDMNDRAHRIAAGVQDIERMIAVTRDGAIQQIRGVTYRLEIANAEIVGELRKLHELMLGRVEADEAPAIEDRFTAPRYLQREAAE
jgi:hypothetical protein